MEHIGTTKEDIQQAAAILRGGGLIAFPTETYYGLGVDPFNEASLKRLFAVKNRPSVKPVLVLVPSRNDIARMSNAVPGVAEQLMDRFWPGPLTMVFPARSELSVMLTGNTGTIGIRISSNPVAQALQKVFGGPVTATSANRSGGNAAVTEAEVRENFGGTIDMVLSGGRTPGGKPSTIIGFSGDRIECIREGCIKYSEITEVVRAGG